ncbi:hypothetical protein ACUW54_000238 [Staphylococcus cohnii]|uniref:Uncharacterized protein n=1 Tax=Staphylococcus cohnii subsp. cohnii TaxID=74704 RepID=A0A0M2NUX4_STACC|nr:hypothetical protein EGX68_07155 [Staphylococcus cohnii]KKI63521.1 hypothetical protein UF66_0568 [Staphylococcus cohnii subsp. cohnii]TGP66075.1 hypothetical protein EN872_00575 [bacterium M00.F.Ca.ET.229.01.1.1]TGS42324.1 hypothetical protein EN823_00575 [bacterium M00.F.Ca.ET.180.01.1.1]OIS29446.1 hypothetical protein RES9_07110 [Staphylococcus cohnii]
MNKTTGMNLLIFIFLIIFAVAFFTNTFGKFSIYLIIILPLIIFGLGICILIDAITKYKHDNHNF